MANYKQKFNKRTGMWNLVNDDGVLFFKDSVANFAALPAVGNTKNDARIVNDTHHMYVWSGTAWVDQGDVLNIDWSTIENKPSSSVVDIDSAVSLKHTQNSDLYLGTQVTSILYVDNARVDSYTENGSITKPFKTIAGATAIATSGTLIKVAAGTYAEDTVLPTGVSIEGASPIGTNIQSITTGVAFSGCISIFRLKALALTIQCNVRLMNVDISGTTAINGNNLTIWGFGCLLAKASGNALTMAGTNPTLTFVASAIISTGDYSAIVQNSGQITVQGTGITSTSATQPTIQSNSGILRFVGAKVINNSTGGAINMNNGATTVDPNVLGVLHVKGNIVCGTSVTKVGSLSFDTGTLTGSNLIYIPASWLDNDSTVTGDTIKDALETLKGHVDTTGNPHDTQASEIDTTDSGVTVQDHIDDNSNPHSVTKTQVGLGNVDNVSEATIIADVKAESDVASAISLKHAASGQFNQATVGEINGLSDKATPVDADVTLIEDSASAPTPNAKKKLTWANIKATLKTYFDGLYNLYVHPNHSGEVTSVADGAQTITANAVANTKLAQMATKTYKGRTSAETGNPEDVAVATLKTDLALSKSDVGLGNVDNTSDATKNSATVTLTNKRINPRVTSVASSATPTPNIANEDIYILTALAEAATFGAPTGTPVQGQKLIIRIKDNASARALGWNGVYRASTDLALPTTTVISKTMYLGFIYNATDNKFDLLAVLNNI
jgi:hypothetical protein